MNTSKTTLKIAFDMTDLLNAFHAAGECRRQGKNLNKIVKYFEIVKFHNHIWNHNEKCIQISTNIHSSICEIDVEISEI